MAAAGAVNPLFPDAPTTDWFLSYEVQEMVAGRAAVWTWLQGQLLQFGTHEVVHDGVTKNFKLLPQHRGRFFIINMHAPDEAEAVPLAFNFHNLYFAGFQQNQHWYFFNDADLIGSGFELDENIGFWSFLGFNGRYTAKKFKVVHLGINELISTCHTLFRCNEYLHSKPILVEHGCFRIIVVLCEPWRFPIWNARVEEILSLYLSCSVDFRGIVVNTFEELFKNWRSICTCILNGPDDFEPVLERFPQYGLMLPAVDVLLRPLHGGHQE